MIFERVKYKLIDRDRSRELEITSDPMNWDDSEKTLKRSIKTFGVFTELSMNLGFVEDAADFLRLSFINKDIEADVILEERRAIPNKDEFYLHSTGQFDFSGYKSEETKVTIPFKTGGLNALVEAQLKEKFELDRLEAINGNEIDPLNKKVVALKGREILRISELKVEEESSSTFSQTIPGRLPPLEVVSQSDSANIVDVLATDDEFIFSSVYNNPGDFFYLRSDVAKTVTVRTDYDINVEVGGATSFREKLFIFKYNFDGADYNFVELYDLVNPGDIFTPEKQYSGVIDTEIDLAVDDSLLFVVQISSNTAGTTSALQTYHYNPGSAFSSASNHLSLTVTELSVFEESQTDTVLMHEAGDKLLQIISGEKLKFYSEFYGRKELGYANDGKLINGEEFSRTGLSLGFWVRNFNDEKLEFSLDNFIKTSNAIHNTGYGIEKIGGVETFVMEDMKYFFQNSIGIIVNDQVSNVVRSTAKEMHYANMSFGYKKPSGDNLYEEVMGLDEYNTQTGYTTPITRVDNKYNKISDARADSYGMEFARRKPKLNFPEEDTRYDKSKFLLDLKTGLGEALEQRVWQDDFEEAPLGVFSPDTATNLRLTPFRNSERHQWFYGSGLHKFQNDSIRHSNTIGNSELSTKKTAQDARPERGSLLISELERPRFTNEWITFEIEIDYFLNQQIYGTTEINGRQIPNYYFKMQFINEAGLKEQGYIFEIAQKNESISKVKLLKAL